MNKCKVGIVGAAGYTAGELLRLLIHHPGVEISWVQSQSCDGLMIAEVHKDLTGEISMNFQNEPDMSVPDTIFLCKGHSESAIYVKDHPEVLGKKIIDLSQDFRHHSDFVYGLPEINREKIRSARHVANPGCFATSIQLALIPAIDTGSFSNNITVSGITGSTGAGQKVTPTSHFSWRSNNASVYKALEHQHIPEVLKTFSNLSSGEISVDFIPYRGAVTRGIITTSVFQTSAKESELFEKYTSFYKSHPFTHVSSINPDLKMVVNTNKCVLHPRVINGKAVVISVIDNLLKGASGQAVQNMNLMNNWNESDGLNLKSTFF